MNDRREEKNLSSVIKMQTCFGDYVSSDNTAEARPFAFERTENQQASIFAQGEESVKESPQSTRRGTRTGRKCNLTRVSVSNAAAHTNSQSDTAGHLSWRRLQHTSPRICPLKSHTCFFFCTAAWLRLLVTSHCDHTAQPQNSQPRRNITPRKYNTINFTRGLWPDYQFFRANPFIRWTNCFIRYLQKRKVWHGRYTSVGGGGE